MTVTVRMVTHREVKRSPRVTQQEALELEQAVALIPSTPLSSPARRVQGWLSGPALGPAHPTGHIPGPLLMMDVASECCQGEIREHLEEQAGTGGPLARRGGGRGSEASTENTSSFYYQGIWDITPIASPTGIPQPHHPGTDFPSNKVNLLLRQAVEVPQLHWGLGG